MEEMISFLHFLKNNGLLFIVFQSSTVQMIISETQGVELK